MRVKVGTFNLNNLFSRFNFQTEIADVPAREEAVTITYNFSDPSGYRIRSFKGRLIKPKSAAGRAAIVERIKRMDLDVLAAQEVEDIDTLRRFNADELGGMYRHLVLIEGNDDRFIDVAVFSKLPIGDITTHQKATHPEDPNDEVFSRDLLQVDVLDKARSKKLFTLYNTHLKSQFVDPKQFNTPAEVEAERKRADARRRQQAETINAIIKLQMHPTQPYILVGDMNDTPDSEPLAAFRDPRVGMVNALANPDESRPAKRDNPPPATKAWTHRFKESGQPARYDLFDHIWISPVLAPTLKKAMIDRRTKHEGDGSDHDPAWIELEL
jgi:endonuclease/exonuclease/phosphatase family metal-dependent hydrolase